MHTIQFYIQWKEASSYASFVKRFKRLKKNNKKTFIHTSIDLDRNITKNILLFNCIINKKRRYKVR